MGLINTTVIYPLLTALVLIGSARALWKDQWATTRLYLVGIGLSFGFLVGYFSIHQGFSASHINSVDRLFFAVSIAGLTAFLFHIWITRLRRYLLMPPATFIILYVLISPLLFRLQLAEAVGFILGTLLIWTASGMVWTKISHSHISNTSYVVAALGSAIIISLDGSLLIGQMAGALTAAAGGWWLLNQTQKRHEPLGKANMVFLQLLLGAILTLAYFYAEVNLIALLLIAFIPFLYPVCQRAIAISGTTAPLLQSIVTGMISSIPVLMALWLVWPEQSLY